VGERDSEGVTDTVEDWEEDCEVDTVKEPEPDWEAEPE